MAFPFFHYLRKAYPRARIAVSCVSWVQDIQFLHLVDEVYVLPRARSSHWKDKLDAVEEAARELRKHGPWDLGFALPNSISTAWLLFRAGVKVRRGYKVEGRGILLNDGSKWDAAATRHRAQAYVDLLPEGARPEMEIRDFWGIPAENDLDEDIPGELKSFDAVKAWPKVEPLEPPVEKYWVLAPGATADSRRWPLEYYQALARRIIETTGMPGLIVGGPSEAPIAERLCGDRKLKLKDFTAKGPVSALSEVFRRAQFTVCNESGLAHVASLCGSHVQIVCGAADPRRTRPIGPGKVQVAINPVECWPCERNRCSQPAGLFLQCLKGISPESVWEEVQRGTRPRS